jgi:hypothetical protein
MSTVRPSAVVLSTTLDPVTYAALGLLARRETPGKAYANVPLARLIREGIDASHPGLWDRLVRAAGELPAGLTPKEQAAALVESVAARGER